MLSTIKKFSALCFALSLSTLAASADSAHINKIRSSPFNNNIHVDFYTSGALQKDEPLYFTVRSHPLGVDVYNDQMANMRTLPHGSTVLIIINGKYRTYLKKIDNNPLVEQRTYFTKRFRKFVPRDISKHLNRGQIVVTVVALNAYGESIKFGGAMQTRVINYRTQQSKDEQLDQKLKTPYILYNEPYGSFRGGTPILLDFIVMNANLSRNGYKVKVYIDKTPIATITSWSPFQILDLSPGEHTVRLTLIDRKGKEVPNPFGEQEATIHVSK